MIILAGGEKGGTGKTTIATNLVSMRNKRAKNVLLVDADKQESANSWASIRNMDDKLEKVLSLQKYGNDFDKTIRALNEKYENIIIDAGGKDNNELRRAMVVADKIIVPIQTSQFDVWTIRKFDSLIGKLGVINPNMTALLIPNRVSTNPHVNELEEMSELAKELKFLKLSESIIYERIAYRKAARAGMSVEEMSSDIKAINEMENLYKEVFNEK